MPYDDDLLVVGSGPGGQKASIAGAKLGRRVGIVGQTLGDSYGMLNLLVHSDSWRLLGGARLRDRRDRACPHRTNADGLRGVGGLSCRRRFQLPTLAESYNLAALDAMNKMRTVARMAR